MTTLHETAYPSLKPDPTARELAELYTPTEGERVLVAGIGKRPLPRMAALIHLKVFQRLLLRPHEVSTGGIFDPGVLKEAHHPLG